MPYSFVDSWFCVGSATSSSPPEVSSLLSSDEFESCWSDPELDELSDSLSIALSFNVALVSALESGEDELLDEGSPLSV